MKNILFNTEKSIGNQLIAGGILLFIPYSILSVIFEYPVILRQDTGVILGKFHAGGDTLIWTWWAFAMVGLPLLGAFIQLGQKLETRLPYVRTATYLGVISLIVQMVGLLRWTFVVPVLAKMYVNGNEMSQEAAKTAFQVIHQYGGVVLGEHLGQLFSIAWTLMMCRAFDRLQLFPKWLIWFGYSASGIYLLAQSELFQTVMPDFPVMEMAGFIGSSLWLLWLIVLGFKFRKLAIPE
jgi:hypothetical protein